MDEDDIVDEDNIVDLLTKMYKINIGHDKEPVQVNSADVYKFHRLQEISDDHHSRKGEKQEVFDEISVVLEDAWRLPEEQRTQIVKRLILRWCPEKNLGDEEFCSEAFEHIKNEISRLGRSYDGYIDAWVARAREHGSHREEYRKSFSREYGSWESSSSQRRRNFPPSFCRRNPQPGEARRWFRQAEADLAAGENEIDFSRPSYEWACFKCHQAAEKALKAAQYTIHAEKTSVHNLVDNCSGLNDSELTNLASQLERLVGGSARMRYPDQMCSPKIPNEVYSVQMAQQALELSKKIVVRVEENMP
ncbi:hypothetical protein OS493_010872 [Desmophyllum pertusum]|uniref:HEPN domain-containing protein n=1 Tax=Desmophyllum pertusum TaxID=174260 RepID=A0A9W9ZED6_9CNID|nr:hypothetical protein OS493_010872 [Desmophyllum pertusum]